MKRIETLFFNGCLVEARLFDFMSFWERVLTVTLR